MKWYIIHKSWTKILFSYFSSPDASISHNNRHCMWKKKRQKRGRTSLWKPERKNENKQAQGGAPSLNLSSPICIHAWKASCRKCSYNTRNSEPSAMLKVDLIRAFDSIRWDFIIGILRAIFSVPENFITWIYECISTASFSVSINGASGGFFTSIRGIRQCLRTCLYLLWKASRGYLDRGLIQEVLAIIQELWNWKFLTWCGWWYYDIFRWQQWLTSRYNWVS